MRLRAEAATHEGITFYGGLADPCTITMANPSLYHLLDALLLVFHSVLVGFNLLGWAWKRTRRIHLLVIVGTLTSWFGIGAVYGWGYCPLTDWHWEVKRSLGATNLPASWIKYHVDLVTGFDWSSRIVNVAVVGTALGAFALSTTLNLRDRRARRKAAPLAGLRRSRSDQGRPAPRAHPKEGEMNSRGRNELTTRSGT